MSHFVVMVTNVDEVPLDDQLGPFSEQGEESDYFMEKDYYLKNDKDEIDAWLRNEIDECEKCINEGLAKLKEKLPHLIDEEIEKLVKKASEESVFNQLAESFGAVQFGQYARRVKWRADNLKELVRIKNLKTINGKLKAIQKYEGGGLDKEGLYWVSNPNAKWDWWVEGGRWDNWLVRKDGVVCNRCLVGEVDFDKMKESQRKERAAYYDKEMKRVKGTDNKPCFWGFDDTVPSREEYIEKGSYVAPYAILHDGQWYEKGEMGWFGIDDPKYEEKDWEEKFFEIFNSLDAGSEVAIVDCHI